MAQPNIVFILLDDMGWRDLSCYGSTFYETPHIDRLAAEGMRFTNAYAACPVCSPTRASILTGKYPATLGLTDWIAMRKAIHPARGKLVDAPYIDHLPHGERTSAAELGAASYQTWHVGKWHLGGPDSYPEQHGFDVNIGGWEAGAPTQGYFSPWAIPTLPDGPAGEHLDDRLTDEAISLLKNRDPARPFFLNLWYYSVHTPIQAKPELVAKYAAKAKALGLDQVQTFAEGDFFPSEHKRHLRIQRRLVQSDPVYAAMIETIDTNIGRLLTMLSAEGLLDNTVVIFTSDNGGLATAEGSPTSNAPLAEGKGWMYEGGTREPLLVHWPGVIAAGSICTTPVTSPDFYPTLLAMAGLDLPVDAQCEGENLMPLLTRQGELTRDAIFWHYPHYGNQGGTPGSSLRSGEYKLIEFFEDGRLEMYNLTQDIGETDNLVHAQPQRAAELHAQLIKWREQVAAKIPSPNPDWPHNA